MKKIAASLSLLLAACSTTSHGFLTQVPIEVRASAGVSRMSLDAEFDRLTVFSNTRPMHHEVAHDGELVLGRLEVGCALTPNQTLGAYVDYGTGSFRQGDWASSGAAPTADSEHVSVGVVGRAYLGSGRLRPYGEARVGYRATWISQSSSYQGAWRSSSTGDGVDAGAALGLEYSLSRRLALHAQVGYDVGSVDSGEVDSSLRGTTLMVGGSFRL